MGGVHGQPLPAGRQELPAMPMTLAAVDVAKALGLPIVGGDVLTYFQSEAARTSGHADGHAAQPS